MKRQQRPLGQKGSFVNNLLGNNHTTPEVGQPATILSYTDRHAFEVIEVTRHGCECIVRRLTAKALTCGMTEGQSYEYSSNPSGATYKLKWSPRRQAWLRVVGQVVFTARILALMDETNALYAANVMTPEEHRAYRENLDTGLPTPGVTRIKEVCYPVSILFGVADEYMDYSF